ncbi:MAG: hypothetical protein DBY04_03505 [Clostridiales bacterium]|nr:MAG: hypothetical protein DBY04_03505 [Clostridiales bacterium]
MHIHHIGIIVNDIEKDSSMYKSLGFCQCANLVVDLIQFNKIIFLQDFNNSIKIELIEPIDERSSVYNFKCGYHHICFQEDGGNIIENFKKMKVGKIFSKPIVAPALNKRKVVFGCLKNGTFIELILEDKTELSCYP